MLTREMSTVERYMSDDKPIMKKCVTSNNMLSCSCALRNAGRVHKLGRT